MKHYWFRISFTIRKSVYNSTPGGSSGGRTRARSSGTPLAISEIDRDDVFEQSGTSARGVETIPDEELARMAAHLGNISFKRPKNFCRTQRLPAIIYDFL